MHCPSISKSELSSGPAYSIGIFLKSGGEPMKF